MGRAYALRVFNSNQRAGLLGVVAGLSLAAGACRSHMELAGPRLSQANAMIGEWSEPSKLAARAAIEEYGVPDEVHYERFIWNAKGPWRRTVVRNVRPFYVQDRDPGIVEQRIKYSLTPAQAADVAAAFGDRVRFDPQSGELSARSDREEFNYLRLNLAHDVMDGTLRPEQARDSYARTVSLAESGKSSPDLAGLRFLPGND